MTESIIARQNINAIIYFFISRTRYIRSIFKKY